MLIVTNVQGSWGIKHFINHYLVPRVLKNGNGPGFQGAIVFDAIMNYDNVVNSQKIPILGEDPSGSEAIFALVIETFYLFCIQ